MQDILIADKQLARELLYDLRREEEETAAAAAADTEMEVARVTTMALPVPMTARSGAGAGEEASGAAESMYLGQVDKSAAVIRAMTPRKVGRYRLNRWNLC